MNRHIEENDGHHSDILEKGHHEDVEVDEFDGKVIAIWRHSHTEPGNGQEEQPCPQGWVGQERSDEEDEALIIPEIQVICSHCIE